MQKLRSLSLFQQNNDDFKVFKKKTNLINDNNKENQEEKSNINELPMKPKTIEDHLNKLQKCIHNESLNDQYLLSSMEQSQTRNNQSQLQSLSFNITREPSNQFIYSQEDFQPDNYETISNIITEKQKHLEVKHSDERSVNNCQGTNDNQILHLLLMEIQRRFDQFEQRLEISERQNRSMGQNFQYYEANVNQIDEKLKPIFSRMGILENKIKQLEEILIQQRKITEKKIMDFNQNIDVSLQKFIESSLKIQNKIDKITQEIPKECKEGYKKQQSLIDSSKSEIENIKNRIDIISQNLTHTHETLAQQVEENQFLQKGLENIQSLDIDYNLQSFFYEITNLKQKQMETLQYLKTLQNNITRSTQGDF